MKILGLDLGVGSVGWALIDTDNLYHPINICGIGSRIINLSSDESKTFNKGKGVTLNAKRTIARSIRKGYYRYKMRRNLLNTILVELGMKDMTGHLTNLSPLVLWKLRNDAAISTCRLSLPEIGRVLLHLNQKRGYRHAKSDINDTTQSDYLKKISNNYAEIINSNQTVGQYLYHKLLNSEIKGENGKSVVVYRTKGEVFPRKAYEEEFEAIMQAQKKYYPEILTPENIQKLHYAISFQRPLKSCKHLVSICDFEKKIYKNKDGKIVENGPKVAPRTSPLSQLTRIYEVVNNIRLVNSHHKGRKKKNSAPSLFDGVTDSKDFRLLQYEYELSQEERERIVEYLNTHDRLTSKNLLKLLGLTEADGFRPDRNVGKGIKGNDTYVKLYEALEGVAEREQLLQFNLSLQDTDKVDPETGEIIQIVSPNFLEQPLYKLWHTCYSISDKEELTKVLEKNFGLSDDVAERLFAIDFRKEGFTNRSARFMRKLLPFLMQGYMYSEACTMIGINHSGSITKEENNQRSLSKFITPIAKNSLRQPIVEKILNQMINIVNEIIRKYGDIDEVRIELARPLKMSAEERGKTSANINKREKENKTIAEKFEEYHLSPTRRRIQKYRMWEEIGCRCMYCGQPVQIEEFMRNSENEIEHIIPRSIFFDDSFSNKTFSCRKCNHDKGNKTAYDYMLAQPEDKFSAYIERVEDLFKNHVITRTKRDRFLTSSQEIPQDFLERDLRQTQYITKKACELLREAIRNVWVSSGSVTDFFRHAWGYDRILHNINLPRYEKANLVEEVEYEHAGQIHKRLQIKDWNKRLDHRHHAIDALTVALTRQGYIQRLNNLNSEHDNLYKEINSTDMKHREKSSLLNKWAESREHFSVEEVKEKIEGISVSHKNDNRLISPGKRFIKKNGKRVEAQRNITVPRGELHEGSIYGKILIDGNLKTLKDAIKTPSLIIDQEIRATIEKRLAEAGGDYKKALELIKKYPIMTSQKDEAVMDIEEVRCFQEHFVMKYPVASIELKNIDSIVDGEIRELVRQRYKECGNDAKAYERSLSERPLVAGNGAIKSIRCKVGLKPESMIELRKNSNGDTVGFAKSGSNHHIAFYQDNKGKIQVLPTTFWTAVKRKKNGLPIIIQNPHEAIDITLSLPDNADKEELLASLPAPEWTFIESLKRGEMFIMGLSNEEFDFARENKDFVTLNKHLYKVQKLSKNDYVFRLHSNTSFDTSVKAKSDKEIELYLQYKSAGAFFSANPIPVKISKLGEIEYD